LKTIERPLALTNRLEVIRGLFEPNAVPVFAPIGTNDQNLDKRRTRTLRDIAPCVARHAYLD
jgi:hypothetical protein